MVQELRRERKNLPENVPVPVEKDGEMLLMRGGDGRLRSIAAAAWMALAIGGCGPATAETKKTNSVTFSGTVATRNSHGEAVDVDLDVTVNGPGAKPAGVQ